MSFESDDEGTEGENVGGEEEDDGMFELIRRVEGRKCIYDIRDKNHSKRDLISQLWTSVADGLEIKGKKVNGSWCKKKWKSLRDYYRVKKSSLKGKSGDAAKDKRPWGYFSAMDRVLSSYNEENENTQSNFSGDDSSNIENESPIPSGPFGTEYESNDNERTPATESTPTTRSSNKRVINKARKRKLDDSEQLLNEKILKVLEEPEEVKDQFYHFGMTICNRLRTVPPQTAEYAMIRISSLLYEITYPAQFSKDNSTYNAPSNESTHDDLIIFPKS